MTSGTHPCGAFADVHCIWSKATIEPRTDPPGRGRRATRFSLPGDPAPQLTGMRQEKSQHDVQGG
jgi:hypothetical protein